MSADFTDSCMQTRQARLGASSVFFMQTMQARFFKTQGFLHADQAGQIGSFRVVVRGVWVGVLPSLAHVQAMSRVCMV